MKQIVKIFFFSILLLTSCGKPPAPAGEQKPLVLVSIAPYQLFAERIGQDLIEVRSIVPQGANAHSYEPQPRAIAALERGRIWFRIGEPFEAPLLKLYKDKWHIVDLRDGILLLDSSSLACKGCSMDHFDRHIWMSPKLAQEQAKRIAEALSEEFPEHREQFHKNLTLLLLDLDSLDHELSAVLQKHKGQTLLVSHPAFGYFCKDYALEQISIEYEGKDPCPRHLSLLLGEALRHRPKVALALPQHNNKGAQILAEELHLPIRMIDPYAHDYFETMRTLAGWIDQ